MATLKEMKQLQEKVAAAKQAREASLQAKIASLSTVTTADLLHLKDHWTQEVKSHRALDDVSMARRANAELWLEAIASVLSNPGGRQTTSSTSTAALPSRTTGISFKTFSEEYLAYVKNNFSQKTLENAERVMKFFVEQFGERDLGAFTLEDLEAFKAQRAKSGAGRTTMNIDIRTIKAAFTVAVNWKRIPYNPFEAAKQLKVDEKPKRVLTREEFGNLLSSIREDWLHDIIAFNVLTGLRLGEIMNLRWTDYDVKNSQITVRSSLEYRVKGGKMRVIPLGNDAKSILSTRPKSSEWIFVGPKGKKYTDDYISKRFKQYVRDAGLPEEIHYHRLRDTYLTWLAEENVPIHVIKAIAGHSSVRVTEGYLTSTGESARREVKKVRLPSSKRSVKKRRR